MSEYQLFLAFERGEFIDLEDFSKITNYICGHVIAVLKFLKNILQFVSNYWRYYKFINSALEKFVEDKFVEESITEIKNIITQTNTKNALLSTFRKVPKFNFKIYAYVYDELIYFPDSDISYETFTTNKFFINVHRLLKVKYHLHHWHITGKILEYVHDFCNTIVIEKTTLKFLLLHIIYLVLTSITSLKVTLRLPGVRNL